MRWFNIFFFSLFIVNCTGSLIYNDNETDENGGCYIKYEASGTSSGVDISYESADGNYYEVDGQPLPWSIEFYVSGGSDSGPDCFLSADNNDNTGSVEVSVYYKKDLTDNYTLYGTSSDPQTATVSSSSQ
jgi:hypothetical protein